MQRDSSPKSVSCHNLLTLISFQACMTFFLSQYFIIFLFIQWMSMVSKHHSSNFVLLHSTKERKSYRFETTWGWVNDYTFFIFGWTIPLIGFLVMLFFIELILLVCMYTQTHMYIYVYMCVCVCVCKTVCSRFELLHTIQATNMFDGGLVRQCLNTL